MTTLETTTTPGGALFAGAFATDATRRELPAGPALTADLRTSTDGSAHVLTVTNITAETQEVLPESLLPHGDGPLLFLGGASTTAERDGRLVARLDPHGFVQLGRALDPSQEQPA
ncbi:MULTISPECIES: hypothetical protein [unclassified Streptomyces]|uniref:hypothetical protein n=1 Tax=unclassified Streptomyces TaxID=2593676 RepID=UPI0023665941|nr:MULTISPECIES: hypothetical protein [unclassified Streptomyces]MDF3139961.1 hypothetical protein [Streptomyces sp. T21Q-yed]WDF39899.1 hypothetical protein PBV52_25435 [Streptomyces sp. T12]